MAQRSVCTTRPDPLGAKVDENCHRSFFVCFVVIWHDLARFGVFVTGFLCAPAAASRARFDDGVIS